ncbi:MAG: hypothetical protein M3Z07_00865 [Candidatus Eremiobacteraeota bacterium]|nr:hypothetical protein [Candidatus Eremiobacteraeota bacterium]
MSALQFDVVGAEGPRAFFSRITKKTIAHAYLFSGPEGIGKKTFARRLAQSLLCEVPKEAVLGYDGDCPSCHLIGKQNTRHPDLMESVGALKIGDSDAPLAFHESDDMTARDLVRQLSLQSYSGGFRVFVLGDIEFATPFAANALLKFFEEPPPNVVLLLTTSTPGRLLATIHSRLVEVRFASLRGSEVAEILRSKGFDADRAQIGAALAQGSATRAIGALTDDEDGSENLRASVARWFFEVVAGGSPETGWASRETLDEGLEILKTLVRDWIAMGLGGANVPLLAIDYRERLGKLPLASAEHATAMLSKVNEAQKLARTNVTPALVSEYLRMTLSGKARAG